MLWYRGLGLVLWNSVPRRLSPGTFPHGTPRAPTVSQTPRKWMSIRPAAGDELRFLSAYRW